MSTNNDELKVKVSADVSGFSKGMADAGKSVDDLGRKTQEAGRTAQGAGQALETVGDAAGRMAQEAAEAAGVSGQLAETVGNVAARCVAGAAGVVGMAAAVGGVLLVAFEQGRGEAEAYAKALIMTGNAAGASVEQLGQVAAAVAAATGATQNAAAEVVAQVAGTGQVAAENVEAVAAAAVRLERAGVQSAAKTVAAFEELGKEPVKASLRLNESTNYLTAALFEQIKALEEQGRVIEAAALAQKAYADSSDDAARRIEQNFGLIERMARGVADAGRSMWDALLGVGRQKSLDQQIAEQKQVIEDIREGVQPGNIEVAQNNLKTLEARRDAAKAEADAKADATRQEKAGIAWAQEKDKYASKAEKREAEILRVRQMGIAAGRTEAEIEEQVGRVREKYAEKAPRASSGRATPAFDYQAYAADLSRVNSLRKQEQLFLRGHLDEVQSLYQMGVVHEEDYLRARTDVARAELAAEERRYQGLAEVAKRYGRTGDAARAEEELKAIAVQRQQVEAAGARDLMVLAVQRQRALDSWVLSERDALDVLDFERSLIGRTVEEVERLTYARRIDQQVRNATRFADGSLKVPGSVAEAYESAGEMLKKQRDTQVARDAADRGDWLVGARRGMQQYKREAEDVAGQVERVFGTAAQGMEDAMVRFAMTGKLSFSDLVNSVIADVMRMQMKAATSQLFNMVANAAVNYFVGSGSGSSGGYNGWDGSQGSGGMYAANGRAFEAGGQVTAFARGGVVDRPTMFQFASGGRFENGLMGEAGPEAIMPLSRGRDGRLGVAVQAGAQAGPQAVRVEIYNEGAPQEVTRALPSFDAEGMVVKVFTRDLQRNGPMAQALTAFKGRS